jgi:3-hydroxymyristoyl/3-hydroxydecanoyl-(acyl carrier protein) dehydratase
MPIPPLYEISDIKEVLPHRSPFLFVDRVMVLEDGERIVAEKDLCFDDCIFTGHFPGNPVMPGVIISEALAQTSGLLLGFAWKKRGQLINKERSIILSLANVNMKFSATARPGKTLRLESILKKEYGRLFYFKVTAYIVSDQIAEGTLTLAGEKN